jgi:hypothetical protein
MSFLSFYPIMPNVNEEHLFIHFYLFIYVLSIFLTHHVHLNFSLSLYSSDTSSVLLGIHEYKEQTIRIRKDHHFASQQSSASGKFYLSISHARVTGQSFGDKTMEKKNP